MEPIQQNDASLSNKEKAISFLQQVASGNVREAYSSYVGTEFSHHNPYFRGDAESLMLAMEESATNNPEKKLDVKRVIEEGDLIAVHSHVKQNPNDIGGAVVHIFRFQNDKIVEMWDIGQPIPEDIPNENGVF